MATNGLVVMTPTSIAYSGTSASINADGSVDFSAVSSLSLNGVFTSDYDNYQVVMKYSASVGGVSTQCALRAGGTNETSGSNYYTVQRMGADGTTLIPARFSWNYLYFTVPGNTLTNGVTAHFFGPYLTQPTAVRSVSASSSSSAYINEYASTHSLSNAYDGFSIVPSSGNITGLLTVFGFNQ